MTGGWPVAHAWLGLITALLLGVALVSVARQRRLTMRARTWLLIAAIFAGVIAWSRCAGAALPARTGLQTPITAST